jgi:uncharacterized protein with PIN domain
MGDKQNMVCNKCNLELVPTNANFSYLGHSFRAEVPRCPGCGQVFIPEKLAKGRIAEVESELEDK